MKFILLAMLGVLPAVSGAQTPPLPAALPEDFLPGLRDILYSAMQQSPQMIAHNIDLAAQEANRYQQAAQEWPSLSGGVGYLDSRSAVTLRKTFATGSTSSNGPIYNLNFNQPIYHWGALQAATDIANLQVKTSERQYADAYRQLASLIRSQYLSLIVQKAQMHNAHYALDQANTALGVVDERFKNKAATPGEVDGAHMQVDDASLAMDRVAEDFKHAKRLLELMAGSPELSDDSVPEEIPKPVYSAEMPEALMRDFEGDGLDKTFQAEIYDYQIKQSELNYKIAKYRLYPRLDFGLSFSQQYQAQVGVLPTGQSSVSQKPFFYDSATLMANWSIFDGFATRGAKLAALASKRAAERNRQNYLDQTIEQARYLESQIGFAARAMALTEKRFSISEGVLQQAKDNLKLGTGSQANVDQATASFYQWQGAVFNARIELFSRWSDYLSLLGIDPVLNNLPAHFDRNAK
ncbi:MAG TPA: TolC family protein [Opitutaceae bacterium]|nr:TolC family protein [Opitutaceae bacterium]